MNPEVDHPLTAPVSSSSVTVPDTAHPLRGLLPYLLKAGLWVVLLYYAANAFTTGSFWVVSLNVFVFSLPLALSGIYRSYPGPTPILTDSPSCD
ncbi:MAG: hypothetical protein WDZ52_00500 [Pseudohongiellaceae bacterium]